jgi:hypothetical protein
LVIGGNDPSRAIWVDREGLLLLASVARPIAVRVSCEHARRGKNEQYRWEHL